MRELTICEVESVSGAGQMTDFMAEIMKTAVTGAVINVSGKIGKFFMPFFNIGSTAGSFIGGLIGPLLGGFAANLIKKYIDLDTPPATGNDTGTGAK